MRRLPDRYEMWIARHPLKFVLGWTVAVMAPIFVWQWFDDLPASYAAWRPMVLFVPALGILAVALAQWKVKRAQAGWYRDVRGLHRLRYWNREWTSWVADDHDAFLEGA